MLGRPASGQRADVAGSAFSTFTSSIHKPINPPARSAIGTSSSHTVRIGLERCVEIDRGQALARFVSGDDLVAKWKSEKAYTHTLMPRIEAAYLRPLPRAAFKRALFVRPGQRHDLELQNFDCRSY